MLSEHRVRTPREDCSTTDSKESYTKVSELWVCELRALLLAGKMTAVAKFRNDVLLPTSRPLDPGIHPPLFANMP